MLTSTKLSKRTFFERIKEWGYQNNIKSHDMQWIIAKRKERTFEGKDTIFFVGGRSVTTEQMDRAKRIKTMNGPLSVCELFYSGKTLGLMSKQRHQISPIIPQLLKVNPRLHRYVYDNPLRGHN
jgi:hypothetical protein